MLVLTVSIDFDKHSPLLVFEVKRFDDAIFYDIIQLDGGISKLILKAPGERGLAGTGLATEVNEVGSIV